MPVLFNEKGKTLMYIKLGGKDRALKFNYKTLGALEDYYDLDLESILSKLDGSVRVGTVTVFIWGMLKNKEGWADATITDIEDALDEELENENITLDELGAVLQKALDNSTILKKYIDEASNEKQKQVKRKGKK